MSYLCYKRQELHTLCENRVLPVLVESVLLSFLVFCVLFCLSSSCVLCVQYCQRLWIVHS